VQLSTGRPVVVTPGPAHGDPFDDAGVEVNGVRVWDLTTGEPALEQQLRNGDRDLGKLLSCTMVDDRAIAVTKPDHPNLQAWDLATAQPMGRRLHGFRLLGANPALCTTRNGRPVVVSCETNTNNLIVWDLATGSEVGPPLSHTHNILRLLCTTLNRSP
jgi:hypothetical protein